MRDPIWRHLGALTVVGFLLTMPLSLQKPFGGWALAWLATLYQMPITMYATMPMVAGVAAGTARLGERGVRQAIAAMLAVMLTMVVLDTTVRPIATQARVAAYQKYGERWSPYPVRPMLADRIGAVGVLARFLTGRLPGTGAKAAPSTSTSPRYSPRMDAAGAIVFSAMLTAPFIVMGVVLGVGAWVRRRVIFRAPRDEVIARWVLAWLVAPVAMVILAFATLANGARGVVYGGAPLWQPLIVFIPFLVVAALGWRAAYRSPPVAPAPEAETSPTA